VHDAVLDRVLRDGGAPEDGVLLEVAPLEVALSPQGLDRRSLSGAGERPGFEALWRYNGRGAGDAQTRELAAVGEFDEQGVGRLGVLRARVSSRRA
jgi:hypothetical protein